MHGLDMDVEIALFQKLARTVRAYEDLCLSLIVGDAMLRLDVTAKFALGRANNRTLGTGRRMNGGNVSLKECVSGK